MFCPLVYLCNASDRDWDTMASVDLVTLHVQGQGVQGDPRKDGKKDNIGANPYGILRTVMEKPLNCNQSKVLKLDKI